MSTFFSTLAALLVAVAPIAVTYHYSRKQDLAARIEEAKRVRYENLIESLRNGFLNQRIGNEERMAMQEEFYLQADVVWLYASDDVVRALNSFQVDFARFDGAKSDENEEAAKAAQRELVYAMRLDLRGKSELTSSDVVTTTVG